MEKIVSELLKDDGMGLEDALKVRLEELTEVQLNNVYYTLYYEELYRDKELRQKDSIIMQMDPDDVQKAEVTLIIYSDDMEKQNFSTTWYSCSFVLSSYRLVHSFFMVLKYRSFGVLL